MADPGIHRKAKIPMALRREVWTRTNGKKFESKCYVRWCHNVINVFDFESGHDVPESKGGATAVDNLYPICGQCNRSMNNNYTIEEFSKAFGPQKKKSSSWAALCCLAPPATKARHQ